MPISIKLMSKQNLSQLLFKLSSHIWKDCTSVESQPNSTAYAKEPFAELCLDLMSWFTSKVSVIPVKSGQCQCVRFYKQIKAVYYYSGHCIKYVSQTQSFFCLYELPVQLARVMYSFVFPLDCMGLSDVAKLLGFFCVCVFSKNVMDQPISQSPVNSKSTLAVRIFIWVLIHRAHLLESLSFRPHYSFIMTCVPAQIYLQSMGSASCAYWTGISVVPEDWLSSAGTGVQSTISTFITPLFSVDQNFCKLKHLYYEKLSGKVYIFLLNLMMTHRGLRKIC